MRVCDTCSKCATSTPLVFWGQLLMIQQHVFKWRNEISIRFDEKKKKRENKSYLDLCLSSWKHAYIILTPLNPRGLQWYKLFFLFLLKNIDCGYSLELPFIWKCSVFGGEISIYLNRRVFVMNMHTKPNLRKTIVIVFTLNIRTDRSEHTVQRQAPRL